MPDINLEDLPTFIQRIKATDPDLYALSQNESSGGLNLSHPQVTTGLNKGTTAGGAWGMMPLTAKDTVGHSEAFKQQYPDVIQGNPEQITSILNTDPTVAYALAKAEYDRRLQELNGDKAKTAYSWKYGLTGAKNAKPEDVMNNPYVQKFLQNLPNNRIVED